MDDQSSETRPADDDLGSFGEDQLAELVGRTFDTDDADEESLLDGEECKLHVAPEDVLDAQMWQNLVRSHGPRFHRFAVRRCGHLGVPISFSESAVQEALLAAMTRTSIEGGSKGAARLIYRVIRCQVINEWRRLRKLAQLPETQSSDEATGPIETSNDQDRLVDAGWDRQSQDAEQRLETLRAEERELAENQAMEIAWVFLPLHAPGNRPQIRKHLLTLRRRLEGTMYPSIAKELGLEGADKKVRQTLRAWNRRGALHVRGWVHALVGTQPPLSSYSRQAHAFWKIGCVAGNTFSTQDFGSAKLRRLRHGKRTDS